jgi:pyruvate/2-oxoglutarate dehydrogenase complex dihydrolipoamide acyltransferase (E2) component
MPREVIMPALGMAQDTGLIVAWRKQAGDKVASGDVLMEVETDKATMEVEAQADGYLSDVRAGEGDNVPVGDVVAMISETADVPESAAPAADENAPQAVAPADGKEIIMPALGMAQETGQIIAWRKELGEKVAADDILLEVETDKSAMEVEAGHDGYVAELRAEAGEAVPVGDVIAIITAEKPDAPVQHKAAGAAKPAAKSEDGPPAPQKAKEPAPPKAARHAPRAAGGRILASPKARRLAAERGLDLARLRSEGVAEPYHVADLERLAALPAPTSASAAPANAVDRIEARVPKAGYAEFRQWLAGESAGIDDLAIWTAFAAASLRAANPAQDGPLVAEAQKPLHRRSYRFADPDLAGLSDIEASQDDTAPALILRDLTGSAVTSARFGASAVPSISVSDRDDAFEIVLDSPAGMLEPEAAVTVVQEMAARLSEPLRHLL